MSKCLACGADLPPRTEGKRERKFCDNKNKCKQLYHSKNQKEKKFKTIPIEQWVEIQKKLAATQTGKAINLDELKLNDTVDTKEKGDMLMAQLKHLGKTSKKSKKVKATNDTEKSTTLTPYQEMLKKKRGF